jgi:cation diffusion facilitator CzcD-associated flavoprotein CzcO
MPPPYKGQESYTGKLVHSSGHGSGADWKGRKALVVGACTSAHDASVPSPVLSFASHLLT